MMMMRRLAPNYTRLVSLPFRPYCRSSSHLQSPAPISFSFFRFLLLLLFFFFFFFSSSSSSSSSFLCQSLFCSAVRLNLSLMNGPAPAAQSLRHHQRQHYHALQRLAAAPSSQSPAGNQMLQTVKDGQERSAAAPASIHHDHHHHQHHHDHQVSGAEAILEAGGAQTTSQDRSRQRNLLSSVGSAPPMCVRKCSSCIPCQPIRAPIQPGRTKVGLMEYYPEAWRCKCKNKLYMP